MANCSFAKKSIAKGIWDVLQMQHMDKDLTNMLFLIRRFFNSQMALRDLMEEHLSKLSAITKEGCYRNSHSKGGKGNNVLNEFASKL
jgi:hypothetical protein